MCESALRTLPGGLQQQPLSERLWPHPEPRGVAGGLLRATPGTRPAGQPHGSLPPGGVTTPFPFRAWPVRPARCRPGKLNNTRGGPGARARPATGQQPASSRPAAAKRSATACSQKEAGRASTPGNGTGRCACTRPAHAAVRRTVNNHPLLIRLAGHRGNKARMHKHADSGLFRG